MNTITAFEYRVEAAHEAYYRDDSGVVESVQAEWAYSDTNPENVSEAIQNIDCSDVAEIIRLRAQGDQLAIGHLLDQHIDTYLIKQSEVEAQRRAA